MLANLARAEVGRDLTTFAATEYVAAVKTMVPQLQLMSGGMSVLKKRVNKLLVEKNALENALEREKNREKKRGGTWGEEGEEEVVEMYGWGGEGEEEEMNDWDVDIKHEEEYGEVEVKNDVKHGKHIRFESEEIQYERREKIMREVVEDQGLEMEMQSGKWMGRSWR